MTERSPERLVEVIEATVDHIYVADVAALCTSTRPRFFDGYRHPRNGRAIGWLFGATRRRNFRSMKPWRAQKLGQVGRDYFNDPGPDLEREKRSQRRRLRLGSPNVSKCIRASTSRDRVAGSQSKRGER